MTAVTKHWTWPGRLPAPALPDPGQTRPWPPRVPDALAALADGMNGPGGIAMRLLRGGFRGRRSVSNACPVARYLADVCGRGVAVTDRDVTVDSDDHRTFVNFPLPAPVAAFVREFDQGRYPFLVEPSAGDAGP